MNESFISEWNKTIDLDLELDQSARKSVEDHLESDLYEYIDGFRDSEHIVTPELCAFQALEH